ncbi:hypothetical protein NZA98_04680, partial [Escherichia coli]|nr:hypothetical protein [Escherichia coli]
MNLGSRNLFLKVFGFEYCFSGLQDFFQYDFPLQEFFSLKNSRPKGVFPKDLSSWNFSRKIWLQYDFPLQEFFPQKSFRLKGQFL